MSIPEVTRPMCSICDSDCDAPRLVCWDHLINEKIKICSEICLKVYTNFTPEKRLKLGEILNVDSLKKEEPIKMEDVSNDH